MDKVQCPVCSKEFLVQIIEEHVSRCLFLNEPTKVTKDFQGTHKRSASRSSSVTLVGKEKSPVLKKSKCEINKIGSLQSMLSSPVNSTQTIRRTDFEVNLNNANNEISKSTAGNKDHVPLAEKMRPASLATYVGQEQVLGPRSVLYQLLSKAEIPNIILWGPPGCGKTSLANVIAHICKQGKFAGKLRYMKLSASTSGVNDVKEAVSIAANELKFGRRTVMFMDEIHRFNKLQQDIFLTHVESGTVTLIGATTENPSFSLNSALLSRCRVVVLEKLSVPNLISILKNAVKSLEGTVIDKSEFMSDVISEEFNSKFFVDDATVEWLAETCDGDARIALGGLELAIQSKVLDNTENLAKNRSAITLEDVKESLKKTHMLYDRKGDQHYDIISALHKSVRASDENASLYWLARMIAGGEDPVYIARRLVRMSSEDIGLEDPRALDIAVNTMHACKMIGMPECDVLLAQCVIYMARAPKSRMMEDSLRAAQRLIANHKGPQPSVPLHLRNAPTKLMENLGYGKGYNMKHKDISGLSYLPEGLEHVNFFQ